MLHNLPGPLPQRVSRMHHKQLVPKDNVVDTPSGFQEVYRLVRRLLQTVFEKQFKIRVIIFCSKGEKMLLRNNRKDHLNPSMFCKVRLPFELFIDNPKHGGIAWSHSNRKTHNSVYTQQHQSNAHTER